jgi:NAD-dependent DNA ligase
MVKLSEKTKAEILKLRRIIKQANVDYHSKGKPKLSDAQYDAAKDRLAVINPSDPLLAKVGAAPIKRAAKINLPVFMGSLDKIYIDEVDKLTKWIKRYLKSGAAIVSSKMDGISALLVNENGVLKLLTRGNGSVGTDISHLISHLKYVPKLKIGQQVRGEIVISKAAFKKFSKDYDNARNLVAGIANKTKTVHEAAKAGEFIIHEMISPKASLPKVSAQLERMGGKVVVHKTIRTASVASITKLLESFTKTTKYDIDGIVIDNGKGERVAIKQINEVAIATVKEVKWQVSRFGYLTPVVILDKPVRLAGVLVKQASGHNAKNIKDNKIGPGTVISIIRSGEVIPKITEVIEGTKPQYPPKGTFRWRDDTNIESTDDTHTDTIEVKKIVNFLTAIGVKNFKDNLISLLYEAGIDTIPKLIRAPVSRLVAAGLGEVQAAKLNAAIKTAMASTTMPKMMVASNIFPRGFGNTAAKIVWNALGAKAFTTPDKKLRAALGELDGLGLVTVDAFASNVSKFTAFLSAIKWEPPKVSRVGKKFKDMVIVFTGFRDAKLQAYLENNGAEIGSTVTKKTTHLLIRDKSFKSEKVNKAKQMGIKIITADQARNSL